MYIYIYALLRGKARQAGIQQTDAHQRIIYRYICIYIYT